jgi:hypothetical protein
VVSETVDTLVHPRQVGALDSTRVFVGTYFEGVGLVDPIVGREDTVGAEGHMVDWEDRTGDNRCSRPTKRCLLEDQRGAD